MLICSSKQVIQFVAQRMMKFDVEDLCNGCFDVKSPDRENSSNGYRDRLWQTRTGDINLKIPNLRLLFRLSEATAYCRKGHGSGHPGGLHPRLATCGSTPPT